MRQEDESDAGHGRAPSTRKRPAQAEPGRDTLGSQGIHVVSVCRMLDIWEHQKHYTTIFYPAPHFRHCQHGFDRLHFHVLSRQSIIRLLVTLLGAAEVLSPALT